MQSFATLDLAGMAQLAKSEPCPLEEQALQQSKALDRFLASVERRAFRIAQVGLRDADEALDVVQGAMLRLARSYGERPCEQWKPLFYRILQNGIRDAQRRRTVRQRVFRWWPVGDRDAESDAPDPLEQIADAAPGPDQRMMADEAMERLEHAMRDLPERQRQAFIFRCLEGMDVADTAAAMGCSAGTVKTHYFRALQVLRARLGDAW